MQKPPEPQENLLQAIRDGAKRHKEWKLWRIEQLYKTIQESQEEIVKLETEIVSIEIAEKSVEKITRETTLHTSMEVE